MALRAITLQDLEFRRVPVRFYSTAGVPQTKWVRVGMPLIPQNVIASTFYLYRTPEHAEAGKEPAGSGFIIRDDGQPSGYYRGDRGTQHFAVTNWHVACQEGASVIRLNKKDGGTDVIPLGPEDWYFIAGKYDVAVAPLTLDAKVHAAFAVSTQMFFHPRPDWGTDHNVYVGDDVFMIGLFVDHDGLTTNVPSARFGNISMLPNPKATIKQPTDYAGESFVIDMHSRTGFSGSPVYVYRTFGSDLQSSSFFGTEVEVSGVQGDPRANKWRGRVHLKNTLFSLLGIHWGQFPERWELKEKAKLKEVRKDFIVEGGYVEGMSGMTCVIPAANIWEVLEMPALKAIREKGEGMAGASMAPKAETVGKASPPNTARASDSSEDGPNPDHREDFTRLLNAAARKQRPDGQT